MMRTSAFRAVFAVMLPALFLQNMFAQATESTIYTFCQQNEGSCTTGKYPSGTLAEGPDGNFYGTTQSGREDVQYGTIFKITAGGGETVLYSFTNGTDGGEPSDGLILAGDGNFYGTTTGQVPDQPNTVCAGQGACGTIFRITPSGSFSTIYTFCAAQGCADGFKPTGLTLGSDGNLYGIATNNFNGLYGVVDIFKVTLSGNYSLVAQYENETFLGWPLLQATDGNFYIVGLSGSSGANNGVVFQITPAGSVNTVYTFPYGRYLSVPLGPLTQGSNGNLYGVEGQLVSGAAEANASIYEMSTNGTPATLATVCTDCINPSDITDGPEGGVGNSLAFGGDGNMYTAADYGATEESACDSESCGTVFRVTPTGTVTTLYSFTGEGDGYGPDSNLIEASNGSFYGTVQEGSGSPPVGYGALYKITPMSPPPAPITVTLSSSSVALNSTVTANWSVTNAFSTTMQQCYAYSTAGNSITPLGKTTGTLTSGVYSGSFQYSATAAGTLLLGVTCGGSESGFATLTIGGVKSTIGSITWGPSPSSVYVGQPVTLIADIVRYELGGTPTGTITFYSGSLKLATVPLSPLYNGAGGATFTASTAGLPPGTYPVNMVYSGDANDVGVTTAAVDVTVKALFATTTYITVAPNPLTPPAAATLRAQVLRNNNDNVDPTGTVTFYANGNKIGAATLSGGNASFESPTTGVPAGTYSVTADYSGDTEDVASHATESVVVK